MLIALGIFITLSVAFGVMSFVFLKKSSKLQFENQVLFSELDIHKAKIHENDIYIVRLNEKLSVMETLENSYNSLENQYKTLRDEKEQLNVSYSTIKQQFEDKNEHIIQLKNEFKTIASEILDTNSKKFSEQNKESLGFILTPMKQQLSDFKKKVEDVYDKESKDRSALQYELKSLKELNLKMSQDAQNLTSALKGQNKTQGNWGEMVLEKVLESSGLREGHEYKREVALKDEENRSFRPDVVVYLPENRHIIIDAKTSLTAYNEYISHEDEESKALYLKSHIRSIKEHIKSLSNKKYEDLENINSLDFIFMFVPIESALLIALENDVNLYDEAFKQKIILVSPTTLLVALRAVENTWRYERQAQSITDVYKRAEELYKKFNGFVEDLSKVGDSLIKANSSYDEAFKKLSEGRGNLISQVTMLKKISNIKPKKELEKNLVETAISSDEENLITNGEEK